MRYFYISMKTKACMEKGAMNTVHTRLPIVAIALLLAGCVWNLFVNKQWVTYPDNKQINEVLELKEKAETKDGRVHIFSPVNDYSYGRDGKTKSKKETLTVNRSLAIEKSFNARGLTTFDQIAEEFDRYNLPCLKKNNENKLTCNYYIIYSESHGAKYYDHARSDLYTIISLTFELLDSEAKVEYDDQSCRITYDQDNRVKNYTQLDIERQKRLREERLADPDNKSLEYTERLENKYKPAIAKKNDARQHNCLNSDLYKKIQHYFKTYYPKKYAKANLGGAEHE